MADAPACPSDCEGEEETDEAQWEEEAPWQDAAEWVEHDLVSHGGAAVPVMGEDPQWGRADAPVTIVVFSNFECPFSSRATTTLKEIQNGYGPDRIRIVWKHNPLPFHENARPTHEAAATVHALGGNFWTFHDLAFRHQKALTESNFARWAAEAGVPATQFQAAFKAKRFASKVERDMRLAHKLGVRATPAFRINGVTLAGAEPLEKFTEIIDAQLKEAATLRAEGKSTSQVYPILTARNLVTAQAREEPDRTVWSLPVYREPAWTVWKVPVHRDDPVRGPQDALVTIVQFADFQCPFSKRVAPTLTQILDRYRPDVRIVWKDNPLPFHPRARPMANFARAVYMAEGNEGFWKAHDDFLEGPYAPHDGFLKAIAKRKGMLWGAIQKAIRDDGYAKKFEQSQDLATNVQARGTPHFFINGVRVAGAYPIEKFVEVIDNRLAEAKALVAKGIPRARLYEHVIKFGKYTPPEQRPSKGNANARIVITVFSDFECPFSARVNPTLEEVLNQHGKDVRIVWRYLPLPRHPNAALAAEAAHEVFLQKGDEAFGQYHDKLFAAQKTPGGLERRKLEDFAAELGVDRTRFRNALDERAHQEVVAADVRAAREAGISGTPTFLVNGHHVSGAKPYSVFRRAIQDAMSHR